MDEVRFYSAHVFNSRQDDPDKCDIAVVIPNWIHGRVCELLRAAQSGAKPEEYIVAVLEGHVRRLNL